MKTCLSLLILLVAVVLPLNADSPVPASSLIEIKMTKTEEKGQKPARKTGKFCYYDRLYYTLEPTFRRGQDAKASNLLLNIYIITTNSERKIEMQAPFSQIIPNDPKMVLVTAIKHNQILAHCKCCREGNRKGEPEWYAEVIKDGEVLCSTQSKLSSEINKLIETRKIVSEPSVKALPISKAP